MPTALLAGLFMPLTSQLIAAAIVGAIIFFLVLAIPLTFLEALQKVFISSTWTLTYRELCVLEKLENGEQAEPEA